MDNKNFVSRVALVKGTDRYSAISDALRLIAGDIHLGKKILIKPNFSLVSKPLVNTHVDAVSAVVDFLIEKMNCDLVIAVNTGTSAADADTSLKRLQYDRIKFKDRIKYIDLKKDAIVEIPTLDSRFNLTKIRIARSVVESDFRISICPPKTDNSVLYSGALTNMVVGSTVIKERIVKKVFLKTAIKLMNFIPLQYPNWIKNMIDNKDIYHGYQATNLNLYKLANIIPPHLSVIDGFNAMEGNGPVFGKNISLNTCIVSTDFLACDITAAWLMGFDINKIGYLYYCSKAGLGEGDFSQIEVLGENPGKCMVPVKPHDKWSDQLKWAVDEPERYFLWLSTRW